LEEPITKGGRHEDNESDPGLLICLGLAGCASDGGGKIPTGPGGQPDICGCHSTYSPDVWKEVDPKKSTWLILPSASLVLAGKIPLCAGRPSEPHFP